MHFPCGQWLAVDQGDGRISRNLTPRVIRVQHYDGMHDAAAQQLTLTTRDPEHCEAELGVEPTQAVKSQNIKAGESSGDSCRSTKIRAVRRPSPLPLHPNMDVWPGHDAKEQPGKTDIMQRYLDDNSIVAC